MKAMVLERPDGRLQLTDLPVPEPGPSDLLSPSNRSLRDLEFFGNLSLTRQEETYE